MQKDFEILELIQDLDLEMDGLLLLKENGPKEINLLHQGLAKQKIILQSEVQKLEKLRADLANKREQSNEETDSIKKKQDRSAEIRNQKEFQANVREIESSRMELAILEEDMKLIRERVKQQEEVVAKAQETFDQFAKEIESKQSEIETGLANLGQSVNALKEKRLEFIGQCSQDFLTRYDRVRRRGSGRRAMVRVSGSSCPNCNMSIPPQKLNEVIRQEALIGCGSCNLLFYWKVEEAKTP